MVAALHAVSPVALLPTPVPLLRHEGVQLLLEEVIHFQQLAVVIFDLAYVILKLLHDLSPHPRSPHLSQPLSHLFLLLSAELVEYKFLLLPIPPPTYPLLWTLQSLLTCPSLSPFSSLLLFLLISLVIGDLVLDKPNLLSAMRPLLAVRPHIALSFV